MKKNILAGGIAGLLIGILFAPVLHNLAGVEEIWIYIVAGIILFLGSVLATIVGSLIGKKFKVVFQVVKFGITGVLNTFVDFGVLNLLMYAFSIVSGVWYSVFKGLSFVVAVANSYIWNKYWTFEARDKATASEGASFLIVSVIGFLINVSAASFMVNYITPMFGTTGLVWANLGALMGTSLAFIWNFVGYKFFVFKK